jgi:hypothetical protein
LKKLAIGALLPLGVLTNQQLHADWSAPVTISDMVGLNPQIAIDPAGNATAIWELQDSGTTVVQVGDHPFLGDWSSPPGENISLVASISARNLQNPQIAVDPAGNAVAIWVRFDDTETITQAATRPFGGDWTTPVDLSATGGNGKTPQVRVDPAGNAVAVWDWDASSGHFIQASALPFGSSSWTPPVNLNISLLDTNPNPHVAVDPAGNAVAVWQDFDGNNLRIEAATLPFGGSWSAPQQISVAGQDAFTPTVAIDPFGTAIAVWTRFNGTRLITQAAQLSSIGGSWSVPLDLSAPTGEGENPDIAFDQLGNAVAIWGLSNGSSRMIQARSLPAGAPFVLSSWSGTTDLSTTGSTSVHQVAVADALSDFFVIWDDNTIQVATLHFGGSWSKPVVISNLTQIAERPKIAISPTGFAVAHWQDDDHETIQASIFTPTPQPPANFQGHIETNKFLNTTEHRLNAAWDPSPSSNVVLYRIYKGAELVATVSATLELEFRVELHRGSAGDYSVTAVNDLGLESVHVALILNDTE